MADDGWQPLTYNVHMIESHDYQVQIRGTGHKTGRAESRDDGVPAMTIASPPEFGGPGAQWSPEHLFVASIASCLMTTFRSIAENSNLEVLEYTDDASGHLAKGEDRYFLIESVTLRPRVVIADESQVDRTLRLLEKAKRACLISRSARSEIWMEPTVLIGYQVGT